jgi:3-methylcrotonyl-CoA carboxylase alpha subunit
MIQSLLIANRGEIACRIIRTARTIGIRTVAVYSDADRNALHVQQADEAVHIGPSPARESYLVGDKIIAAAKATGAQAIHPGYGFLSENAEFAQAVIDAGLIWVGPRPASITAMGLKDAAKKLMSAAGVPVTPGYMGEDQDPDFLAEQAAEIGYPVLIKAVAGGGGKGMRKVDAAADFIDALASCQREATSSFGNAHVLIEKYIQRPRHIEVQVFGDTHGNIVHLFERDCSLQRRHQKVIEEAPAPGMDAATRAQLCAAAVKAAKAVDYVGAGTIEFIADASEGLSADRIWFMEMNTRLQVEHPVTEEITGVDLVEWQLRVASGEALPKRQDELSIHGWAIEARLYAEDPARGFLPSVGRLDHLILPDPTDIHARIETGVSQGSEVSPFYDPMIAKLVVAASSRTIAIDDLARLCEGVEVWPVRTNAGFLKRALDHQEFRNGNVSTGFLGDHESELLDRSAVRRSLKADAAAMLVAREIAGIGSSHGTVANELQFERDVWLAAVGFRSNARPKTSVVFSFDGEPMEDVQQSNNWLHRFASSERTSGGVVLFDEGEAVLIRTRIDGASAGAAGTGTILAPMPGRIIAVDVAAGDGVTKGQKLVTLEAMKMEHSLTAPFDGTVAELNATAGGQVSEGTVLVKLEPTA